MGASARAAAQSAVRAGYEPWCVDLFADRDLADIAFVKRCRYSFYPEGMIEKMRHAPASKVLITGAFEHHPDALRALAMKRQLFRWTLKQIFAMRDPKVWQAAPDIEGVKYPAVLNDGRVPEEDDKASYLVKPLDHAHPRHCVKHWQAGEKPDASSYLQQWIEGLPMSAVYTCKAGQSVLLGVTRQLIGDAKLYAPPMAYCGSIGPLRLSARLHKAFTALGEHLAKRFQLDGIFNIDAILSPDETVSPIEINPRYSASVEIFERFYDIAAFGELPQLPDRNDDQPLLGKAYVFNGLPRTLRGDEVLPHLSTDQDQVADIPQPWRKIAPGSPICTLFAKAQQVDDCIAELHDRASRLYTALSI